MLEIFIEKLTKGIWSKNLEDLEQFVKSKYGLIDIQLDLLLLSLKMNEMQMMQ